MVNSPHLTYCISIQLAMDPEFSISVLAGHLEVAQWKTAICMSLKLLVVQCRACSCQCCTTMGMYPPPQWPWHLYVDATIIAMNMKFSLAPGSPARKIKEGGRGRESLVHFDQVRDMVGRGLHVCGRLRPRTHAWCILCTSAVRIVVGLQD